MTLTSLAVKVFFLQGERGHSINFLSPTKMNLPLLKLALLFGSSFDVFTTPRSLTLSSRVHLTREEMK